MIIGIEFFKGYQETSLPLIKLTKSRNGQTGTATFLFIHPTVFQTFYSKKLPFESLSLIFHKEIIQSKDITIFFKEGKPFLIKVVFLFKNSFEWFTFLKFMHEYSKETGLSFSEK